MLNEANFMAYVRKMHQLNEIAAQEMQAYIDQFKEIIPEQYQTHILPQMVPQNQPVLMEA